MSAFCVFGVTKQDCLKAARKKTRDYDLVDGKKVFITMDAWNERVAKLANELFEIARSKQISPAFDSPAFARDWIEVGKSTSQITRPKLMCKGEKKDKKGAPMIRKGKPVIGWVPYAH